MRIRRGVCNEVTTAAKRKNIEAPSAFPPLSSRCPLNEPWEIEEIKILELYSPSVSLPARVP